MACDNSACWINPQPKHSYLVHLADESGECTFPLKLCRGCQDIVVQASCLHDLSEWVTQQAKLGKIAMTNPRVVNVDATKAAHRPILDQVS